MYYNNTKENKDNNRLKLTANLMKSNLPSQMQLMTFKKINSLQNQYLIRLQNMAEWNDAYETGDNIVTVDMAAICQALKLKVGLMYGFQGRWLKKYHLLEWHRKRWSNSNDSSGLQRMERARVVPSEKLQIPKLLHFSLFKSELLYYQSDCVFVQNNWNLKDPHLNMQFS